MNESTRQDPRNTIMIYEPNQRANLGLMRSWVFMFSNLINSRYLTWQLFKRDFISGYKQSFFGIFWIFISPLIGVLSWVFMNYTGILNPGDVGVPYPVYVLVGSIIWGLFISIYTATAGSLSLGGQLILQINFSHEALVAQQIAQTGANFVVNLLLISLVLFIFGIAPSWKAIFFPLTLIPIFLIGTGIGLVIAVITVVVQDFNKLVSAGLGFLMFLTPVIYAPKFQNKIIQNVVKWNPMSYLIVGARDIILYGRIENMAGYFYSCLLAIVVFMLSWRFFFLSEYKIAEKL